MASAGEIPYRLNRFGYPHVTEALDSTRPLPGNALDIMSYRDGPAKSWGSCRKPMAPRTNADPAAGAKDALLVQHRFAGNDHVDRLKAIVHLPLWS